MKYFIKILIYIYYSKSIIKYIIFTNFFPTNKRSCKFLWQHKGPYVEPGLLSLSLQNRANLKPGYLKGEHPAVCQGLSDTFVGGLDPDACREAFGLRRMLHWLVVLIHLKNLSQIGNLRMKRTKVWNHQLVQVYTSLPCQTYLLACQWYT